jgi:hypothetical protein
MVPAEPSLKLTVSRALAGGASKANPMKEAKTNLARYGLGEGMKV